MNEPMALEDVLSGKEEAVVEPEAEEKVEETAEPEKVEAVDETEPEAEVATDEPEPKGVEEAEPPAAETTKEVPLAALLDERDKRKEIQSELERLKAERESTQQEKVDFWENPEAALTAMEERLTQQWEAKTTNALLSYSMQSASYRHEDYDEQKDAFAEAAKENPALADQALASPDPGEYIYTTGKQFSQLNAVGGDISALEQRIRNEIRAEFDAKAKAKTDKLKAVPTSLTDETSASTPREKVEGGPTPLVSIFKHNQG